MIDLKNYGFVPGMKPEDAAGLPARVTAVHKERYELVLSVRRSVRAAEGRRLFRCLFGELSDDRGLCPHRL